MDNLGLHGFHSLRAPEETFTGVSGSRQLGVLCAADAAVDWEDEWVKLIVFNGCLNGKTDEAAPHPFFRLPIR